MTRMVDQQWHYVPAASAGRYPRHHVFLDVEAKTDRTRKAYGQTWRLAVATMVHRPKGGARREHTVRFNEPAELWDQIQDWVPRRGRLVLWAHNLGYDVRVSRALVELPARGWRLVAHSLTPGATWLTWRREESSILMVDSSSVFPMGLDAVATLMGTAKLPMPTEDSDTQGWLARCLRDVEILKTAILSYLDRIESMGLGEWRVTGTAQAWASFRANHMDHLMLVHQDPDARAAERRAMWTGRCEAYWHGLDRRMTVHEWDMTLAYPRVARQASVPTRLATVIPPGYDVERWFRRKGFAVLAECYVDTQLPLVPMERDGRICWPVGRFHTTLWDPEIRLLLAHGAKIEVTRGWAYHAEPALSTWAEWIVGQLDGDDDESPAWWKAVMKHWARALIGRLAMTYKEWEHVGEAPTVGLRRATYVDLDTGERGETMQVGQELFVATKTVEWDQGMPAITGYVQSHVRATLTTLLMECPDRTVLYSDTDSLLVSEQHHARMMALAARHPLAGLRLKRSWQGIEIKGPRQLVTGKQVRVSGLPRGAKRLPDGRFEGEVWESLAAALAAGRGASVRITPRVWALRGVDRRRQVGTDGWTVPVSV